MSVGAVVDVCKGVVFGLKERRPVCNTKLIYKTTTIKNKERKIKWKKQSLTEV